MRKGQVTEEELFSNQEHSESFEQFLELIGKRVELKGFGGFRGGLDTSQGQTGDYSVYENYQNKEIMFHVSTLLPYSKNDSQQLERKRHIGNDIVTIVYQEDNTPFAPDMIASNFLHTFIVVQRFVEEKTAKTKYRVSVVARKDVPNFGPAITMDSIYDHDQVFKDWLLSKLINAELASYKADKFRKLKERTRMSLFDNLYNELHEQNKKVLESMFPGLNLNSNDLQQPDETTLHRPSRAYSLADSHSSNLLMNGNNSNHGGSTHSINGSASFKFSLFNTVRKAFKKDKSDPTGKAITAAATANNSSNNNNNNTSIPTTPKTPDNPSHATGEITHPPIKGRQRSSTFDSGTTIANSTLLTKIQQNHPNYSIRKLEVLHEKV